MECGGYIASILFRNVFIVLRYFYAPKHELMTFFTLQSARRPIIVEFTVITGLIVKICSVFEWVQATANAPLAVQIQILWEKDMSVDNAQKQENSIENFIRQLVLCGFNVFRGKAMSIGVFLLIWIKRMLEVVCSVVVRNWLQHMFSMPEVLQKTIVIVRVRKKRFPMVGIFAFLIALENVNVENQMIEYKNYTRDKCNRNQATISKNKF